MDSARNGLEAVASRQAGVVSRAQVLAAGVGLGVLRSRIASGELEPVGTGVYRVAGASRSWEQRVWAACLETGGLASHRTAGWLWGLDGLGRTPPKSLELIVPNANKCTTEGAQVRRSRTLVPSHACKTPGVPKTNLARTVIDLSEVLSEDALEEAFDSALRKEPELRSWVRRLLRAMPTRGHAGIGKLSPLVEESSPSLDSALEVKLRRLIRAAHLPSPHSGVDVVDDGRHVAKLDFAWPDARPPVALLAHGFRWHGKARKWRRDLAQVSLLSALGWRVVQCTASDVEGGGQELIRMLRLALAGHRGTK